MSLEHLDRGVGFWAHLYSTIKPFHCNVLGASQGPEKPLRHSIGPANQLACCSNRLHVGHTSGLPVSRRLHAACFAHICFQKPRWAKVLSKRRLSMLLLILGNQHYKSA